MKWTAPILFLAALILMLGGCGGGGGTTSGNSGGTTSAEAGSRTVDLTPLRQSGVSGTATFSDTEYGARVKLDMKGFKTYLYSFPVRVHEGGTCADDGAGKGAPVEYVLSPVIAGEGGTGSNTNTIVGVTVDQLFSGSPKYITVHDQWDKQGTVPESTSGGLPPAISCADFS